MCNVNFVNGLKLNGAVIYNLTSHTVNLLKEDLTPMYTIKPEKEDVRCTQTIISAGYIGDIPITSTSFCEVEGLPEEKEGVYYIVSRLFMQACSNRNDLLAQNELKRDEKGKIIGCLSLANN